MNLFQNEPPKPTDKELEEIVTLTQRMFGSAVKVIPYCPEELKMTADGRRMVELVEKVLAHTSFVTKVKKMSVLN